VRALTRKQPKPGTFPGVVEIALGDLGDPVSVAEAIKGADELFLLIGNVADEFTQARTAYGLAKKAGLKHVTYLSVFKADQFFEVHFAAKYAVEEASRAGSPSWPAYDLRAMYQGYFERGFSNTEDQTARFAVLPGHQPRTYSSFAEELAREWVAVG
jgi:uncharacterized protein YbjT (DUF2867 family)